MSIITAQKKDGIPSKPWTIAENGETCVRFSLGSWATTCYRTKSDAEHAISLHADRHISAHEWEVSDEAKPRTFADVIYDIRNDIIETGQKVPFGAVPYMNAIGEMYVTDPSACLPPFYIERVDHNVRYLLGNLKTYKGERARALKAELKTMIGAK